MTDLDDLEAKARAAVLAIAEPDGSMTLVERDRAAYQFRLATTPSAVLELIERVRAAEHPGERGSVRRLMFDLDRYRAIVRDLAAFLQSLPADKHQSGCPKFDSDTASTCTCEADTGNIQRARLLRRAVEAIK